MTVWRRAHEGTLSGLALLLVVAFALAPACREVEPQVTAVRIATSWPSGMVVDQLAFELHDYEGQMLGPRELRPPQPSGPLQPGADVVVYLRDDYGGRLLRTVVQGLSAGRVVGSGEGQVTVTAKAVADLVVSLDGGAADAGPTDGGAGDQAIDKDPSDVRDAAPRDASPSDGIRAAGQPCTASGQCVSGSCTDGVCCEVASCGTCRACNLPGWLGVCQPVPAGAPEPRGACAIEPVASCGSSGKCDGNGACQKYAAGTICQPTACHSSGEAFLRPDICDGMGMCVNLGTQSCGDYRCNPSTFTCFTACTDGTQCAMGKVCRSGRCQLP